MYCEKFNVFASIRNGFRKGESIITASHECVCNVFRGRGTKKNVLGIFLDLIKAFDTIKML